MLIFTNVFYYLRKKNFNNTNKLTVKKIKNEKNKKVLILLTNYFKLNTKNKALFILE